jgi:hypothetical protein
MAGSRLIKDEPGCRIRVEPGTGAAGVVVKIYRRRGLAAGMRALLRGGRARREFEALTRLASLGVPCSPPLSWRRGFSREHGFYELLATREIPGAAALEERLKAAGRAGPGFDAGALFRVVARMHRAGIYHGALGPKNILVAAGAPGPPGIYLVDFARAKIFPASIFGRRIAGYDLLQLVVKLERHLPAVPSGLRARTGRHRTALRRSRLLGHPGPLGEPKAAADRRRGPARGPLRPQG